MRSPGWTPAWTATSSSTDALGGDACRVEFGAAGGDAASFLIRGDKLAGEARAVRPPLDLGHRALDREGRTRHGGRDAALLERAQVPGVSGEATHRLLEVGTDQVGGHDDVGEAIGAGGLDVVVEAVRAVAGRVEDEHRGPGDTAGQ